MTAAEGNDSSSFNILTVCTMNICRSPAMEFRLLRKIAECEAVAAPTSPPAGCEITVASAGTSALVDSPGCELSLAYAGTAQADHRSRALTPQILGEVDLVLTAAWAHSSVTVAMAPRLRDKVFPIRLAARLASYVVGSQALDIARAKARGEQIDAEDVGNLAMVPALPEDQVGRLRWLVSEMHEARGLAPRPAEDNLPYGVDDIPDPHVLGYNLHELSGQMIAESVSQLSDAAVEVLRV